MRTSLSVHFTYGMNEVGNQTCVVELGTEWRSTLRTLIYFPNNIATTIWNFNRVMFRFFFRPLAKRVSLSSLSYVHNCKMLLLFVFVNSSKLYAIHIMFSGAVFFVYCSHAVLFLVTGVRVPGPIIFLSLLFFCCV